MKARTILAVLQLILFVWLVAPDSRRNATVRTNSWTLQKRSSPTNTSHRTAFTQESTSQGVMVRGHGAWWLKRDVDCVASNDLGRRAVGQGDEIVLYPEGREGKEINIHILLTKDMNPDGSDRDTVMITISDSDIEVVARPMEAATGEVSFVTSRGKQIERTIESLPGTTSNLAIWKV